MLNTILLFNYYKHCFCTFSPLFKTLLLLNILKTVIEHLSVLEHISDVEHIPAVEHLTVVERLVVCWTHHRCWTFHCCWTPCYFWTHHRCWLLLNFLLQFIIIRQLVYTPCTPLCSISACRTRSIDSVRSGTSPDSIYQRPDS